MTMNVRQRPVKTTHPGRFVLKIREAEARSLRIQLYDLYRENISNVLPFL